MSHQSSALLEKGGKKGKKASYRKRGWTSALQSDDKLRKGTKPSRSLMDK